MREDKLSSKSVLLNFVNHVDTLEANKYAKNERYEQEFQELKKLTENLKSDREHASHEGQRECNRRKNRYKDILPYDCSRVDLQNYPGIPGSDYINANYIRGASGSRAYIASQGPLPHTVNDFWRMVVECEVQVIVMASNESEGGKHKCECYWATTAEGDKQFGNVHVTFIKSRQVCPDFLVRTFKIKYLADKNKTEERIICQFHYVLWPDHGVPDTVRPLLDMVRLVRDCQASETLPVLVHCSAGCGRTGTICAIDYVWGLLRTGKLSSNLDLFGIVKEMRQQRVAMVQTREQYMLLHQAVKELFKDRLKLIDAHPYENVATDGNPLILRVKENDYEELFVSQEKQDKSMKSSPTSTPPTHSLTRPTTTHAFNPRDSVRKSASTSSLDPSSLSPMLNRPNIAPTDRGDSTSVSNLRQLCQDTRLSPKVFGFGSESSVEKRVTARPSKMEKDAENLAQVAKQKLLCPSYPPTPSRALLPVPPPRSRTPSPVMARKRIDTGTDTDSVGSAHYEPELSTKRKSTEIVRRPSIQKLRELFEKQSPRADSAGATRGTKLSRSASSVTTRPSLSIAQKSDSTSLKVKRKSSLGSQDNLHIIRPIEASPASIKICPPPPSPPSRPVIPMRLERSSTSLALTTCKSVSNPNTPRPPRVDDRPVLPIKKSKSFRWSRGSADSRSFVATKSSPSKPVEIDSGSDDVDGRCKTKNSERYKLSVYQEPSASAKCDSKPMIPPKKNIGDRHKSFKLLPLPSLHSQPSFKPDHSATKKSNTACDLYGSGAFKPATVKLQSNRELLSEVAKDLLPNKSAHSHRRVPDYVNARAVKSAPESPQYTFVPVPSKRTDRDKHDYANLSVVPLSVKSPLYDQSPVPPRASVKYSQRSDHDTLDFGECLGQDDVFESVNHELLSAQQPPPPPQSHKKCVDSDSYLNKDLDSIATQVYQDCHEYLLGSNNRSSVPSLMPKSESAARLSDADRSLNETALEEVRSKVAVPPQGLRNRERRNSYRQAVNSPTTCSRVLKQPCKPRKLSNEYEKIWFGSLGSPGDKGARLSPHTPPSCQDPPTTNQHLSTPKHINAKDGLFKDKLEELNHIMTSLEMKHSQMLPDVSEEELSSRNSGSTSSLLSRSGQSSRSSDRPEPIYANIFSPNAQFGEADLHLTSGGSQYGTLATTTSHPYKARTGAKDIPPYQSMPYTATLPVRSAMSPSSNDLFGKPIRPKPDPRSMQEKYSPSAPSASSRGRPLAGAPRNTTKVRAPFPKGLHNAQRGHQGPRRRDSRPHYVGDLALVGSAETGAVKSPYTPKENVQNGNRSPLRQTMSSPYLSPPPPKPLPAAYRSPLPTAPTKPPRPHSALSSESSGDDEEEGVFMKFSAPNFLKKFRSAANAEAAPIKNPSRIAHERRVRAEGAEDSSPSESPKPFAKALGKIKLGSKNVAANFKSYLKGNEPAPHTPLQKSVSCVAPSVDNFNEVIEDFHYPVGLARKPNGTRLGPSHTPCPPTKAREQYL